MAKRKYEATAVVEPSPEPVQMIDGRPARPQFAMFGGDADAYEDALARWEDALDAWQTERELALAAEVRQRTQLEDPRGAPPVVVEFPKWLYGPHNASRLVKDPEEQHSLGPGWRETP